MSEHITLFEVGPRDGLQSYGAIVSSATKIALIDALSLCGFEKIEATSFVSAKWVPQLADAAEVMGGIQRNRQTRYAALTPNLRGFEDAVMAGCDEVAIFAAASEGFSRANLNCSISESLERFRPIMARAMDIGMPVRGYLSTVIACPYDGPVLPEAVAFWTQKLLDLGCYEISLGDTIGAGTPESLSRLLDHLVAQVEPKLLAGHFHDTHGLATKLISLSLQRGIRCFDASVGGVGGCPYAPGAAGNVNTRAALDTIAAAGFSHGIDMFALKRAEEIISQITKAQKA